MTIEQTVLEKLRDLSKAQQEAVLDFMDLLQQQQENIPTEQDHKVVGSPDASIYHSESVDCYDAPPSHAANDLTNGSSSNILTLLDQWMSDASGYDEQTWPELHEALEHDHLNLHDIVLDE